MVDKSFLKREGLTQEQYDSMSLGELMGHANQEHIDFINDMNDPHIKPEDEIRQREREVRESGENPDVVNSEEWQNAYGSGVSLPTDKQSNKIKEANVPDEQQTKQADPLADYSDFDIHALANHYGIQLNKPNSAYNNIPETTYQNHVQSIPEFSVPGVPSGPKPTQPVQQQPMMQPPSNPTNPLNVKINPLTGRPYNEEERDLFNVANTN